MMTPGENLAFTDPSLFSNISISIQFRALDDSSQSSF
jgi:hypothetical protein